MKKISVTNTLLVLVLAFPWVVTGEEPTGRLPPNVQKYPDKGLVEQSTRNKLTLYSRDGLDAVDSFYRNTLKMEPLLKDEFLVGYDTLGEYAGQLWVKIKADHASLNENDLFGFLEGEISIKKIRSKEELEQTEKKYAHLIGAWYPDFDADQKLKSCSESTTTAVTANLKKGEAKSSKDKQKEMLAEIQKLMAQGRHKDIGKVTKDFANQQKQTGNVIKQENKTDHWDEWIECLDEVDKHDYRTRIEIDLYYDKFKPSTNADRKAFADQIPELINKKGN